MKNLTPVMRQYLEIKACNSDSILFFRMGDFYEMFFEDAVEASRLLGIALTSRDKQREIPMCGVPYHSAGTYIARLVKEGRSVAICEQVGDPRDSKGIVERAVERIITPGTAHQEGLIEPNANNFIAALCRGTRLFGFAYMDVSTGEFRATELEGVEAVVDEITRLQPRELLVPDGRDPTDEMGLPVSRTTPLDPAEFEHRSAFALLCNHYGTNSLDGLGLNGMDSAVMAAGALLGFARHTQRADLHHVGRCVPYHTHDYLVLDHATRRNLEIMSNLSTGSQEGTLLSVLDRTCTAMGGRLIRSWLLHPLKDAEEINRRADAVSELFEDSGVRRECREILSGIQDMERLMVRVSLGTAGPADMVSLKGSLCAVPGLAAALEPLASDLIVSTAAALDGIDEAVELIERTLVDAPPRNLKDGGFIREGADAELDELRSIRDHGKDWIARLESTERERTGIASLKIGYNRVFGYYIEVGKAAASSVPEEYIRKQTLVNAERYITPELRECEEKILGAAEKAASLELSIFKALGEDLAEYAARLSATAAAVAVIDALASFAEVSRERDYTRAIVDDGESIIIEGGRHPVIEAVMPSDAGGFVANDLAMDTESSQIHLITGPNMAGKSTFLRQNALIVLMAQTGCFVPASRAVIGVMERIFTRVGASDDLSRGRSTFMVEMNETANILNNATNRSLIVLDEIGRGTSTFDGLSIAWAVVEYFHDTPGLRPMTLFATHYHELTEMTLTKERVKNYNMAVKEWDGGIIFLKRVVPGGSSRSYGIQVARLAGLPPAVIERAREVLRNLESGELTEAGLPRIASGAQGSGVGSQGSLLKGPGRAEGTEAAPGPYAELREAVEAVDVNNLTPMEALGVLDRLKGILEER